MLIQVYQDRAGEWRWRMLAANGRTVADSGEGYSRERDARRAIKAWRKAAWTAPVVVVEMAEAS